MRLSLENLNHGHNLDMGDNPEGINGYADKPDTFEEHLAKFHNMIASLPTNEEETKSEEHIREIEKSREAVLASFNKNTASSKNSFDTDKRISTAKNRVIENDFIPGADKDPLAFPTNKEHIYRATGINQIVDIMNCGYVRPKEGKIKGGHRNEVFWSLGNDKLKYRNTDNRLILEVPTNLLRDGQIGAISLDDLSAIWFLNEETGQRENKVGMLKDFKKLLGKFGKTDAEELSDKLKNGFKKPSITDISSSF